MILSQPKIKYLRSLEIKKNRVRENKIVLDGKRLIDEAINQEVTIEHIWVSEAQKDKTNFLNKIMILAHISEETSVSSNILLDIFSCSIISSNVLIEICCLSPLIQLSNI